VFAGMTVRDNLELGAYRRGARAERHERLARVHDLFPILRLNDPDVQRICLGV
jgi:ABC-type branched-subunit amino acid transport system ATPase component